MNPIVSAPTPLRNKSEFTFGFRYLFDDDDGKKKETASSSGCSTDHNNDMNDTTTKKNNAFVPACGFLVTGWSGGVSSPHCCANIPKEHCTIVDLLDQFVQHTSSLPVYDSKTHRGFWRMITIRTSRRTNECMIIIQHTSPLTGGTGDTNETYCHYNAHFQSEQKRLIELLTSVSLPIPNGTTDKEQQQYLKVTSIFFQEFSGLSSPPPEHPVQVRL